MHMRVIHGTLPYEERYWKSLRVIKRNTLNLFGSSPIPIDPRQNLYNMFYVFGAPRGMNAGGEWILPPNPNKLKSDTVTLLNYVFDTDIHRISQNSTENKELIVDLMREFPGIPESATPSFNFALNLAKYLAESNGDKTSQIVHRWNAVASAIDRSRSVENFEHLSIGDDELDRNEPQIEESDEEAQLPSTVTAMPELGQMIELDRRFRLLRQMEESTDSLSIGDDELDRRFRLLRNEPQMEESTDSLSIGDDELDRRFRLLRNDTRAVMEESNEEAQLPNTVTASPVELPELVQMIVARIPFEDRSRTRLVNRTWNASVSYTTDENQKLFQRAFGKKPTSRFGMLLQYERYNNTENDYLTALERILKDPHVDPSKDNNYALRRAIYRGHLAVIDRLLQDPRVDPSANNNEVIKIASQRGYTSLVERLLQDPRVANSLSEIGSYCAEVQADAMGYTDIAKLLSDHCRRVKQNLRRDQ